jgi:purine-binding chemotaxis protein CheW
MSDLRTALPARENDESRPKAIREASHMQTVLRERAVALAHVEAETFQSETIEVVEFVLAGEHYAIETAFVREVFPLKDLTPLPCTPSWMRGIVNVRSQILAVIDLKLFFHLPAGGLSDLNKLIILQNQIAQEERTQFGILADLIVGTHLLPVAQLQTEQSPVGIRRDYVRGITSNRLVVLNAAGILSDETLVIREEVAV